MIVNQRKQKEHSSSRHMRQNAGNQKQDDKAIMASELLQDFRCINISWRPSSMDICLGMCTWMPRSFNKVMQWCDLWGTSFLPLLWSHGLNATLLILHFSFLLTLKTYQEKCTSHKHCHAAKSKNSQLGILFRSTQYNWPILPAESKLISRTEEKH